MSQKDDFRLSITSDALLRDAMQAHAAPAERMAKVADHTRRIERFEPDVIGICGLAYRDHLSYMITICGLKYRAKSGSLSALAS